jgi:hypothetical protein
VRPAGEEGYTLHEVDGIKVYLREGVTPGEGGMAIFLDKFLWLKKLRVMGLQAGTGC